MIEYGLFEDGDLIEDKFFGDAGKTEAEERAARMVAEAPAMVGAYAVLALCPDHEGLPKDGCEECATDEDDLGPGFCMECGETFESHEDLDAHQEETGHEMEQPDHPLTAAALEPTTTGDDKPADDGEEGDDEEPEGDDTAAPELWVPSRVASLRAARRALSEMPDKWREDPAYWVGRLGQALEDVMHHVDTPTAEIGETEDDEESTDEEAPEFEPVGFRDVHMGDTVQFVTANNGFGGGDDVWRTGTVVKVTDKTVTVEITGPNPLAENVFVGGKSRKLGRTASLRRAEWQRRCVSKAVAEQPARRPYSAENVRIVDDGTVVTAVWVSDPTIDPAVALENILHRDLPYEVEVIAEASRFYKHEGADFSGWVVAGNGSNSDGIPNKRDAMRNLRYMIRDHFAR